VVDGIVNGTGKLVNVFSTALRYTQSGLIHNYALTMVLGMVVMVAIFILQ
jgi:NADH-quinone oxidoreductase subunit L